MRYVLLQWIFARSVLLRVFLYDGGKMMNDKVKRMVTLGMLSAIAYIAVSFLRIPIVLFLSYEPKDVVITIGGLIMGPIASLIISVVVSFVEYLTISGTGIWGLLMNILSTCSFACTASWIYKKKHSMRGAVIGLIGGVAVMVPVMLLWNYLITPIYMGQPREAVEALLLPVFLPFNLFKGVMNAALTLLLYKPVVRGLRKASLIPETRTVAAGSKRLAMFPAVLMFLATGVLILLVMKGII